MWLVGNRIVTLMSVRGGEMGGRQSRKEEHEFTTQRRQSGGGKAVAPVDFIITTTIPNSL